MTKAGENLVSCNRCGLEMIAAILTPAPLPDKLCRQCIADLWANEQAQK